MLPYLRPVGKAKKLGRQGSKRAILVEQLTQTDSPLEGDMGPCGRVKRRFHPEGGNVLEFRHGSVTIKRVCWHGQPLS